MRVLNSTELVYISGGEDFDEVADFFGELLFEIAYEIASIILEDFIYAVVRSIYMRCCYTPEVIHTQIIL